MQRINLNRFGAFLGGLIILTFGFPMRGARAQAPNQNFVYVAQSCGSPAISNCYVVYWDTDIVNDATFTSGSATVTTTSGDPAFTCGGGSFPCTTGGDIGKYVVGTYDCLTGNPMQCQNEFTSASATIVKVNSAHSVNISQNAAASSVAGTGSNFSWGHDDTTTLQSVATQVVSTTTAPTSVILPCGATTIRGAFIRRGISSANTTQAFPIGVSGCPSQGTVIVMTPDSSCSSQTDAPGCFFSDNYIGGNSYTQLGMGDRLSNLLISSNIEA